MPKDHEDRGKHKGQKKKEGDNWCTGDISIDEDGNLFIENADLGIAIERAWTARRGSFDIYYYNPNSPSQKVNVQCPC